MALKRQRVAVQLTLTWPALNPLEPQFDALSVARLKSERMVHFAHHSQPARARALPFRGQVGVSDCSDL